MFFIFNIACKKYGFAFELNTCGKLVLVLHPHGTFETIYINQGYYSHNFNKLFFKAIKEMKQYRKKVATDGLS